ncbi:type IV secretory system conjugative DNA transfer family protein [Kribbella monticola]|uniref:type IV secretory system conjugative DNA transfer family protein n=1 Tax=Kribbella monticola TaxID=2185285 RepID=UPI000DD4B2F8|nr:hypothetical protein [Kribbella monticola]
MMWNRKRERQTYRLAFPSDLKTEMITAWLGAITGMARADIFGSPSAALELWATATGIEHRLRVSTNIADYVVRQLRTLVPGIRVEPNDIEEDGESVGLRQWDYAIEVGSTNPSRTLRIPSAETLSASLLASVQTLKRADIVMVQLVFTPAVPEKPPVEHRPPRTGSFALNVMLGIGALSRDEVADRRHKLAEPNFHAVLRVAGRAAVPEHARLLVRRVQHALAGANDANSRFKLRMVPPKALERRIDQAAEPMLTPMRLTSTELAGLSGLPIGQPHVAGLPPGQARHLPATAAIPRRGRVVARSNFPGAERPLAISAEDSFKHLHVIGGTGVGKTTVLANMMAHDFAAGYGVILVESKRDLFKAALDLVPKYRLNDVIVLDVTDTAMPVGFNILSDGNPRGAVERICQLFDRLYHDTRGVWTRELLYMGLRTIVTNPKYTFVDLPPLLIPMTAEENEWRDELIGTVADVELKNFWTRFQNQPKSMQDRIAQPVMDRIWQLNARAEIRNIIGQSESKFDIETVLRNGGIVLVNLAGVGEATASLAGTLLLNSVWAAVQRVKLTHPTFLYLDEFQSFLNLPISPEEMLAKARSFGLGMVLAHQHLAQLPLELRGAVMANARSKVVFQLSADDAMVFSREFGRSVDQDDFMNLGAYEVICRLATGASISQPVTGMTLPPGRSTGMAKTVRHRSRNRYGRPVRAVEQEIAQRRSPAGAGSGKQRPHLGPVEWK